VERDEGKEVAHHYFRLPFGDAYAFRQALEDKLPLLRVVQSYLCFLARRGELRPSGANLLS